TEKLLTHVAMESRSERHAAQITLYIGRILIAHGAVVAIVARLEHFAASGADRFQRERSGEPVHDVDEVAVVFDDQIARKLAPVEPVLHFLVERPGFGPGAAPARATGLDEPDAGHSQRAELSRLQHRVSLEVHLALAPLEAEAQLTILPRPL